MNQSLKAFTDSLSQKINSLSAYEIHGTVSAVHGLVVKVIFKNKIISMGSRCTFYPFSNSQSPDSQDTTNSTIMGEVVGFSEDNVLIMPYGSLQGIGPGCRVVFHQGTPTINPSLEWKGRTLNALCQPIDGLGDLPTGPRQHALQATPILSSMRARVHERIDVGIRAINTFLTCCKGQRMGIFAGSGVGKSMLLSMFAKYTDCDICIIGLVGERGREVKEFIEETLGEEGLKRSILVVATSDEAPLMRRQAAHLTLSLAEYYRDMGLSVLCLMDSVTRFAMAQREIGLSASEPPTTKGYPPSVFAELPKLLERAGPGVDQKESNNGVKTGYITGLFTVLVDGDDTNEPISDAVRGILDGHIILDRSIAERGRFPAINILKSISRTMPGCHSENEQNLIKKTKLVMATYEDMVDMIRLGAYRPGTNEEVDRSISIYPALHDFLSQKNHECMRMDEAFSALSSIMETVS